MAQPNYLRRNIFSAVKFNNNEILLTCVYSNFTRNITKLTISNNNTFIKEYNHLYYYTDYTNENLQNYIQILKNNNNDIIFLIIYKDIAEFHQFGYSYCKNRTESLFNGIEYKLNFIIEPGIFKGHDNEIVFINNTNGLNSIVYGDKKEKVIDGIIYDADKMYFYLSLDDFDSIEKTRKYNITFRNTLNKKESQTCTLTLYFFSCDKEFDICGYKKDECYDRNWNKVDRNEKKNKKIYNNCFNHDIFNTFSNNDFNIDCFYTSIKN